MGRSLKYAATVLAIAGIAGCGDPTTQEEPTSTATATQQDNSQGYGITNEQMVDLYIDANGEEFLIEVCSATPSEQELFRAGFLAGWDKEWAGMTPAEREVFADDVDGESAWDELLSRC